MIQSVDSLSLAQEINKRADEAAKTVPVLLEVNLAGEASNVLVADLDAASRIGELAGRVLGGLQNQVSGILSNITQAGSLPLVGSLPLGNLPLSGL